MPVIRQMPAHLADLIAAGEVVERPGSAVKELVENSLDAGAVNIVVEIKNGGLTFLRVTDNGCGMGPADAETAFLRHATSKLQDERQLDAIGTLGFRGEALAAIAAVSKIDLLTREAGSETGTALHLEAGTVTERGPAGCPEGTTIIVRDLFYNTPARMKYMKRDSAEAANVSAMVQRQALAHPEVSIRLLKDGQEQLRTPGDGKLRSAIYAVLGRELANNMVPVAGKWEHITVQGYVTKPTASRGSRNAQYFFVNGRPVKSKSLTAALEQAYANQLMVNRYPACVLHLRIPLEAVDVNVHPAKTEVRFLTEKDVSDCVHYGVLSALNRTPGRPEMQAGTRGMGATAAAQPAAAVQPAAVPQADPDFFRTMTAAEYRSTEAAARPADAGTAPGLVLHNGVRTVYRTAAAAAAALPDLPEPDGQQADGPAPQDSPVTPAASAGPDMPEAAPVTAAAGKGQKESRPAPERDTTAEAEETQQSLDLPPARTWRIVGEVMRTYIIVEEGSNVLFIDKHAAHERVLFEKFRARKQPVMAQSLLQPFMAGLSREEAAVVLENRELLEDFGFYAEDFGDGNVLLRQVPDGMDPAEAERTLQELAGQLLSGCRTDPGALRDELLHTVACKAAIKAGYITAPEELEALVREVLERDDIKYCPHGRPVCVTMTQEFLEKQFRRT